MKHVIFILLIFLPPPATPWELKKEKSGITIFTREVEDSEFHEFKAKITLTETSLLKVLRVILDVENYSELFPDCYDCKILETKGEYYDIHYFAIDGPPLVKDRDAIYEQQTTLSQNNKRAEVRLLPLPDYLPDHPKRIRMKEGTGYWLVEENVDKSIAVTYQFHGNPGGDIPAILANSSIVTHSFKTLKNLQKSVSQ